MESGAKYCKRQPDEERASQKTYQGLIGSVNYAAVAVRADILYTVGLLGRFASDPSASHYEGAKRLLRYLKKTEGFELGLGKQDNGIGSAIYADADFAGNLDGWRSTSGMVVKDRYGATVAWKSTKQPLTTRSTGDAEYIATAMAMEFMWIANLEAELHHEVSRGLISVFNDNEACIANLECNEHQPNNRHVGVRYSWIRDMVRLGKAMINHIPSDEMPADSLTKGLDREKHNLFLCYLGLK